MNNFIRKQLLRIVNKYSFIFNKNEELHLKILYYLHIEKEYICVKIDMYG